MLLRALLWGAKAGLLGAGTGFLGVGTGLLGAGTTPLGAGTTPLGAGAGTGLFGPGVLVAEILSKLLGCVEGVFLSMVVRDRFEKDFLVQEIFGKERNQDGRFVKTGKMPNRFLKMPRLIFKCQNAYSSN